MTRGESFDSLAFLGICIASLLSVGSRMRTVFSKITPNSESLGRRRAPEQLPRRRSTKARELSKAPKSFDLRLASSESPDRPWDRLVIDHMLGKMQYEAPHRHFTTCPVLPRVST